MVARTANLVWRITYARYITASATALAADLSLFMTLLHLGMSAALAAALSYCLGLFVHWMVSSRVVFPSQLRPFASQRRKQKMLFVASTGVGLAVTTAIVGLSSNLGLDPRVAKLIAAALSFQITYILRKTVVFA